MLNKLAGRIQNKFSSDQFKTITNIGWLTAERVFRMPISFITLAWTARYLGVDQFGSLNYALAFWGIFSPIFQLASDQIIFRDLVNTPEDKEKILGTSFLIKFFVSVLVFFVSIASILLLQSNNPLLCKLVIILSTSSFIQGFNIIEFWFQSKVESKYTIWARSSSFILVTLVRIALLELQAPLLFFAWVIVAESAFNIIGFIFVYQLDGSSVLAWRFDRKHAQNLIKISYPLIFSTLAILIYTRIDVIMLGQLADSQAVGTYSAAVRLSELWPFAAATIVRSVAPSVIKAKGVNEELYYGRLQKLCNLQVVIVYCVAIPMTFLATPFTVLVFGSEYAPAGFVLAIHIWSSIFVFLGYAKEIWISTEELTGFSFVCSLSGAILNIFLNLLLIPVYKEAGAAIATVISYGFADYVMCFIYPSGRKFGWVMTQAMSLNLIKKKYI